MNDVVNHPSHYTSGKIEVIDYIEDQKLPYHLGNVVKYISRAGKKDPAKIIEDLRKAEWYLCRYITVCKKQKLKFIGRIFLKRREKIGAYEYATDQKLSGDLLNAILYISKSEKSGKKECISNLERAEFLLKKRIHELELEREAEE